MLDGRVVVRPMPKLMRRTMSSMIVTMFFATSAADASSRTALLPQAMS